MRKLSNNAQEIATVSLPPAGVERVKQVHITKEINLPKCTNHVTSATLVNYRKTLKYNTIHKNKYNTFVGVTQALLEDPANGRIRRERVFRDHNDLLVHKNMYLYVRPLLF